VEVGLFDGETLCRDRRGVPPKRPALSSCRLG